MKKEELNIIEKKPFNAETPMKSLTEEYTSTSQYFVRNHFNVPEITLNSWSLTINGEVESSLNLSLSELQAYPKKELIMTMECAGNGRAFMKPVPGGTRWVFGAVSTIIFSGTALHNILNQAKLNENAKEVVFIGADQGEVDQNRVESYSRSLPLETTLHPDTLLVWELNYKPLTENHGYPLRLVVPNWYGMASVKWLKTITVQSKPFEGYFQKERYMYKSSSDSHDAQPINIMKVRSLIGYRIEGAKLALESFKIQGSAWSGYASIKKVEISTDGGIS